MVPAHGAFHSATEIPKTPAVTCWEPVLPRVLQMGVPSPACRARRDQWPRAAAGEDAEMFSMGVTQPDKGGTQDTREGVAGGPRPSICELQCEVVRQ